MTKRPTTPEAVETPSARNRSATEARLIEAALQVFGRVGFQSATVSEIAEKAAANVALINRYFAGKQGLFDAVIDHIILKKQEGLLPYPPADSLEDEIRHYLIFRYKEDRRNRNMYRLILAEAIVNDAFKQRALSALTYAEDENFAARLKDLAARGKIKASCDLKNLFRIISLFSFSAAFIEGELLEMPATETESVVRVFAQSISAEHAV